MLRFPSLARCCSILALTLVAAIPSANLRALGVHHPKMMKQQVEDLEQQWRKAALAGDIASMDRMLSNDFVGISWNGQVSTKAMQLDRLRTREFVITRLDMIDSRVKLLGNVAIVTSLAQLQGSNEGTDFSGTFRYTRVYQRVSSGEWKITNFEATRVPDDGAHPHHGHAPTQ